MLEEAVKNSLDQNLFPYVKPPLDKAEETSLQSQSSLRSAKPTWARNKASNTESRQRIIVFIAGGATYSESRACYDVSKASGKNVILATSHMLTPADRPKPKAPAYLFERNDKRPEQSVSAAPLSMQNSGAKNRGSPNNFRSPGVPQKIVNQDAQSQLFQSPARTTPPTAGFSTMSVNQSLPQVPQINDPGNTSLVKGKADKKNKHKDGEKKKRGFFGSKK